MASGGGRTGEDGSMVLVAQTQYLDDVLRVERATSQRAGGEIVAGPFAYAVGGTAANGGGTVGVGNP